jgi:hypothetical protein
MSELYLKRCFITEYPSPKVILISFDVWQIGNSGVYRPNLKPAQSALCRHGGEGGYEQPSKQVFVGYLTAKKLV